MSKKVKYASEGKSYQTSINIKSTLIFIVLILLTIICLGPIYIMVMNATREHSDIVLHGISLIPGKELLNNLKVLQNNDLYSGFYHPLIGMKNSLIIASSCCALTVFFSGLTAYGLVVSK